MDHLRFPERLDKLSAAYALGSLRGGARRRFETLCRDNPNIRSVALLWRERLSGLTELEREITPQAYVWTRIENALDLEQQLRTQAQNSQQQASSLSQLINTLRQQLKNWQRWAMGGALAGSLASVAAVLLAVNASHLREQLRNAPEVQYIAVLADDKSSANILVTFDPKNQRLSLKRVGDYQEANDKSLQLWALPQGAAPQSLAVLNSDKVIKIPVNDSQVRQVPTLAISLEPKGGVPSAGGPTGPVLFKGALLQAPM